MYCNTLFPWRTSNCAICLLSLIEWGLPRGVQGITSIVSLRNLLFIFGSLYGPYYGSYFTTKKYSAAVYYHKHVPVETSPISIEQCSTHVSTRNNQIFCTSNRVSDNFLFDLEWSTPFHNHKPQITFAINVANFSKEHCVTWFPVL